MVIEQHRLGIVGDQDVGHLPAPDFLRDLAVRVAGVFLALRGFAFVIGSVHTVAGSAACATSTWP